MPVTIDDKTYVRKQYYLVPFAATNVTDEAINNTRSKYQSKFNCTMIEENDGWLNRLESVENYATLLIDGHSSEEASDEISAEAGNTVLRISVDDLALSIDSFWKLDKGHQKIRMLACYGAAGFAPKLAKALSARGYYRIHVAGYLGPVGPQAYEDSSGRGVNPVTIEGELNYGKERIAWFNGLGEVVDKPEIDAQHLIEVQDSALIETIKTWG